MTAKRDTSRQRRASQNRSAREALQARRQAAANKPEPTPEPEPAKPSRRASRQAAAQKPEPTAQAVESVKPSRRADPQEVEEELAPQPVESGRRASRAQAAPVVPARSGRRTSRAQAAPVVPAKSRASRSTGGRPSRTPPLAVEDDAAPASGIISRAQQLADGRQMLAAFVLVVAGSLIAAFLPIFPEKTGSKHLVSLVELLGVGSLTILLLPIVLAAIPLITLNNRRRRLAWNVAPFLLGLWVLTIGLLPFYLLGLVAMIWGLMKSSRAERPAGRGGGLLNRMRIPRAESPATVDVDGAEVHDQDAKDSSE